MNEAPSKAFKIYFSIDAQRVFDNEEQSWEEQCENLRELGENRQIQLIYEPSSWAQWSGTNFRRSLDRAVGEYCREIELRTSRLTNTERNIYSWCFSNSSYPMRRRRQKLREYLIDRYEAWVQDIEGANSRAKIIQRAVVQEKEKDVIIQLGKIASKAREPDPGVQGMLTHEVHFDDWMNNSDPLGAFLICVNEASIQEWAIHRLHRFSNEFGSSDLLPLNLLKFGRCFERQLLNAVASSLRLPSISDDYADEIVIEAILSKVRTESITFIFYGLDQVSVQAKEEIWKFWIKVINQIKTRNIKLSNTKLIALMPHSISKNCLAGRVFVNQLPSFESIEPSFMENWMLDKDGNDVVEVQSLFEDSDYSYEDEIKNSLLSAYESVEPLIRKINHYATKSSSLKNLRKHWRLAQ